eukprot:scaffold1488_cov141-Amphora_coffeaeformis.AAC.5
MGHATKGPSIERCEDKKWIAILFNVNLYHLVQDKLALVSGRIVFRKRDALRVLYRMRNLSGVTRDLLTMGYGSRTSETPWCCGAV